MMKNSTLNKLVHLAHSRRYWIVQFAFGLSMILGALYYQHELDQQPCVMCIQVRILFLLLVVVAYNGLLFRKQRVLNTLAHVSVIAIAAALVERSYQLLGTERGFVFGDCGFDLGLPSWLAIEEWLPWLFRVETSCGYTPEIIFGITMAETLIVLSAFLLLLSFVLTLASIPKAKQ